MKEDAFNLQVELIQMHWCTSRAESAKATALLGKYGNQQNFVLVI
jgi:hypothetical protein